MGFGGKKSSQPAAAPAADTTPQVTTTPVDPDDDGGRPGTRKVARFRSTERDRDASVNPGSESGGDDPMGGRPRARGRKSAAMLA